VRAVDAAGTAAGSTQDAGEAGPTHGPARPKRDRRGQDRPRVRAPRPRRYDRHGLTALKRTVATLGAGCSTGASPVARELREWRTGLERDLGGDLSTQERVLVDLATTTKLLLGSIDSWLLTQKSLINARRKSVLPAVRERQGLAVELARIMGQLGLKRRAVDGGDASRALLEVKRLREAATESAPAAPSATSATQRARSRSQPHPPPRRGCRTLRGRLTMPATSTPPRRSTAEGRTVQGARLYSIRTRVSRYVTERAAEQPKVRPLAAPRG
jgi:hypothetical protein